MPDKAIAEKGGRGTNKKKVLTGKEKAAVFLISIGSEVSSEVLKHLKEDEIEEISFELARANHITSDIRDEVLMEFQELMMAQDFIMSGGVDYAREVLERALGTQRAVDIINRLTSSLQTKPFDFIRKTDPAHLVNFIQNEHPQTIALILSYLDPGKAALILAALNTDLQADIMTRIATMDRTSPEILREVERVLERKLSTLSSEDFTSAGGIDAVVAIINNADRTTERNIIETLEEDDPELAEEIKKKMFVFEDIITLDDKSIQKVMRNVDNADLSKALKSVDAEVQDKIFRNMSKRAAQMLKDDMEFMGPVRLKEVEETQQKIVSIIRKLEEQGEIIVSRGGDDDLVV